MTDLTGALCRGLHLAPLFESTDASNHAEAAEICGAGTATECPAFAACAAMARELEAGPFGAGPVGTWAGELYGLSEPKPTVRGRKPKPREHGTDRGYYQHYTQRETPCRDCKAAHKVSAWLRTKAQVNPTIRTSVRVESGAISGPESASTDRGLATVSTTAKGA